MPENGQNHCSNWTFIKTIQKLSDKYCLTVTDVSQISVLPSKITESMPPPLSGGGVNFHICNF
jgi:hypothetical protein